MRIGHIWRFIAVVLLAAAGLGMDRAHAAPAVAWQVVSQGGRFWPTLFHPAGLAVGGRGNVFVADSGNLRLVRLDTNGGQSLAFGTQGPDPGQFGADGQGLGPDSVAVDRQGNLYIADAGNSRVDKFAPGGVYLESWPIQGPDYAVKDLAITMGPGDTVYLAIAAAILCPGPCPTYYIVQKRSLSGNILGQWRSGPPPPAPKSDGTSDFDVITHISIAVGGKGMVYVATTGILICYKSCPEWWSIDKRSPNGKVMKTWNGYNRGSLQVWPSGLAVDRAGNVYVADALGHAVVRLSPDGRRTVRWSHFGWGASAGRYAIPNGVALDAHGNIYVSDNLWNGIVKLSASGKQLAYWSARGSSPGRFASPLGVAIDAAGNLYVDDAGNARVQKVAPSGKVLLHFPVPNIGPAIAVDRVGTMYVSQIVNRHVVISHFSAAGTLLSRWQPSAFAEEQPTGLAVGSGGRVYAGGYLRFPPPNGSTLPNYGGGLLVLDRNGKQQSLTRIGIGPLFSGLALDASGNLYLIDVLLQKGMKLSPSGATLATWTLAKPTPGQIPYIAGIAVGPDGTIYVTDGRHDAVRRFSSDGKQIAQWGGSGIAPGQFHSPVGIAIGAGGTVYVADRDNDRVQKLPPAI